MDNSDNNRNNPDIQNKTSENSSENNMGKRKFLSWAGAGLAGLAGLSAFGCAKESKKIIRKKPLEPSPIQDNLVPTNKMTYRVDPKDKSKISLLGFGCMRYPTVPDPKDPSKQIIDREASFDLVDFAMKHGVNYYDTAWFYHNGTSEAFTGEALKKYPRDKFFLASKMPGRLRPTLEQAKEIFQKQLDNCQVTYFDYYLLHNLQALEEFKEVYEKNKVLDYLLEEKRKGRIRRLGWSFHGDREMFDYALSLPVKWDFVQIQLNYKDWDMGAEKQDWQTASQAIPAKWMYETLTGRNIPVIVMEPLLGGSLAKLNNQATTVLKNASSDSVASWAFRFAGSLPKVLTVLSGMTYMEHLKENIITFSPLKPLSVQEYEVIKSALEAQLKDLTVPCTECNYCMPCPYGVDIPANFSYYNKRIREDSFPSEIMDPEFRVQRQKFLRDYDSRISDLAQAGHCIGCRKCTPKCPQKIRIPKELGKIHQQIELIRKNAL